MRHIFACLYCIVEKIYLVTIKIMKCYYLEAQFSVLIKFKSYTQLNSECFKIKKKVPQDMGEIKSLREMDV